MSVGAPLSYARECGPRSLAVLLDVSPQEAADRLWPTRPVWRRSSRPHPTAAGVYGTSLDAMGDVLVREGRTPELWSGDGRLLADPSVYREHLARTVHERVLAPVRRVRRPRERTEADHEGMEAPEKPTPPEWPPLTDWLDLRPGGGWWLPSVVDPADGLNSHVMPVWGPRILIAEEKQREEYGSWRVYQALRVRREPEKRRDAWLT